MALDDLARFTGRRPGAIVRPPSTCVVVRADAAGVWVAQLDDDSRDPIGPCRGGAVPDAAGVYQLLPVGTAVLLIWTNERPWIAAHDKEV